MAHLLIGGEGTLAFIAEALEFMDRPSLRSVEKMEGVPAILVEFQGETQEGVQQLYQSGLQVFKDFPLLVEPQFTQNADEQAMLWKIRKGLYPSAAGLLFKHHVSDRPNQSLHAPHPRVPSNPN